VQKYDKCILRHKREEWETVGDLISYQSIVDTWRRCGVFDLSIASSWEEKWSVVLFAI